MKNLLLSLLLLSPTFAQAATCNVYTESSSHIWDAKLLSVPAPAVGRDHAVDAFVPKFSKTAAVFPRAELLRRIEANEFQDLDGGTMVHFQQSYENRYDVTLVTIDSRRKYDEMPSVMMVGPITKEVGIGLLLSDQKVFVNCTEKVLP